jgi:hypothetical protein
MIEGQLHSAMLYDWFKVDENYNEVIRPVYSEAASFPGNIILPWIVRYGLHYSHQCTLQNAHVSTLFESSEFPICRRRILGRLGHPTAEDGELLYKKADECCAAMSARLGSGPYFLGEQ